MPKHQLWDDEKFKTWLKDGAKSQGMTVLEALKAAGLSRFYLKPQTGGGRVDGRQTNAVLNLAQVLNKSPAELFGLPDPTPQLEAMMRRWRELEHHLPQADSDDEFDLRIQRMTVTARVIAGQLAAFIYAASDRADTDPAVLLQMIMHEINNGARKRKAKAAVSEPSA